MKNGKRVILFDFDGTVVRFSLPPRLHQFLSRNNYLPLIPILPLIPLLVLLYLSRPVRYREQERISVYRELGERVVICSSTKDYKFTRWLTRTWRKWHKVFVDRLALCSKNESAEEFKARIAAEESPDIFIDNEEKMVLYVMEKQREQGFRSIRVKDNGCWVAYFYPA